ncbi:PFL_4695 family integrating conjugative element protein [Nitrogeniibacter aestuarii]|uniref:PFL_4695 family integrating conjugative element protein n=1 Tax=Nitrogeniibacter aestuarii TaxID=2815343 RepID=UPI0038B28903
MRFGLLCAALLLLPVVARAEVPQIAPGQVQTIHDGGGAPIGHLLDGELVAARSQSRPMQSVPQHVQIWPVITQVGSPGRLSPNPFRPDLPGGPGRNFAIVGDDDRSHTWLRENRDRLKSIGAVAMVVQVQDERSFLKMKRIADIPLVPVSGDDVLRGIGIDVWPVLIEANGNISQ